MKRTTILVVVAAHALLTGCASARSHGPVSGVWDGDTDVATGATAPGDAPMAMEAEAAPAFGGVFAGKQAMREELDDSGGAPPAPPPPPKPAPASKAAGPEGSGGGEPAVVVPLARLMIYTGAATVLVPSVQEAQEKLTARVMEIGGYVESQSGDTSANTSTVTYRVPVEKFFELKKELASFGQVLNDTVQAEDVTKQVFDLEIRLENAGKARERLVELLKQATKMEDILQIEAEVRRLTDEIESMKGQLRFLKDRVSFSTLTVSLYSNAPPPVTGPRRVRSRFEWINQVGPERVLNDF